MVAITNKSFTISGTSVSLGGSITDEVLFGGDWCKFSGSSQIDHDATETMLQVNTSYNQLLTVGTIGTLVFVRYCY